MFRTFATATAATVLAGAAGAELIAFNSFEEPTLFDGIYSQPNTDASDPANGLNVGDVVPMDSSFGNTVEWTRTGSLTDSEMSFNSVWVYGDPFNFFGGVTGLSPNSFNGVTSFSPSNGFGPDGTPLSGDEDPFPSGVKAFQMQSTRGGFISTTFETVEFTGPEWFVTIDLAFDATVYENNPGTAPATGNVDFIDISVEVSDGTTTEILSLINIFGDEINDQGLADDQFRELGVDLSGYTEATLSVTWQAFETIWIDDVRFVEGIIPAPGAAALLALGGLASARRRRH